MAGECVRFDFTDQGRVTNGGTGRGRRPERLRCMDFHDGSSQCGSGRSGTSCHSMQIISDRRKNVSTEIRGKFGRNPNCVLALVTRTCKRLEK
jgi:hypothetical protein